MCVIYSCDTDMPSLEMLEQGEQSNPHGGGYSTIIKGKLIYRKGLTAKEIHEDIINGKIQTPCIIHFRIKSSGEINEYLTHPFEISDKVELNLEGKFNGKGDVKGVFFHNGTISGWKESYFNTVRNSQKKCLKGFMSDSRSYAFQVAQYGHECLDYIDTDDHYNKFAVMTLEDGITLYGDWKTYENIKVSNLYFVPQKVHTMNDWYGSPTFNKYSNKPNLDFGYDELNDPDCFDLQNEESFFDSNAVVTRDNTPKKYGKKARKLDIKYLKGLGWKNPQSLNNDRLQTVVKETKKSITEIDKVKSQIANAKNDLADMSLGDYESIMNDNESSYKDYLKDKSMYTS